MPSILSRTTTIPSSGATAQVIVSRGENDPSSGNVTTSSHLLKVSTHSTWNPPKGDQGAQSASLLQQALTGETPPSSEGLEMRRDPQDIKKSMTHAMVLIPAGFELSPPPPATTSTSSVAKTGDAVRSSDAHGGGGGGGPTAQYYLLLTPSSSSATAVTSSSSPSISSSSSSSTSSYLASLLKAGVPILPAPSSSSSSSSSSSTTFVSPSRSSPLVTSVLAPAHGSCGPSVAPSSSAVDLSVPPKVPHGSLPEVPQPDASSASSPVSSIIQTVLGESSAVCSLLKAVSSRSETERPAPKTKKASYRKGAYVSRPCPLSAKLKNKKRKLAEAGVGPLLEGGLETAGTMIGERGSLEEGKTSPLKTSQPNQKDSALLKTPEGQKKKKRKKIRYISIALRAELTQKALKSKTEVKLKRITHADINGQFLKANKINKRCGRVLRQVIRNCDIKRYLMLRASGQRCKPPPLKPKFGPKRTPKVGPAGSKSAAVQQMLLAARTGTEDDLWAEAETVQASVLRVPKPQKPRPGVQPIVPHAPLPPPPPPPPPKERRECPDFQELLKEGVSPTFPLNKLLYMRNERLSPQQKAFATLLGFDIVRRLRRNRALDALEGTDLVSPGFFGLKAKPKPQPNPSVTQEATSSNSSTSVPSPVTTTATQASESRQAAIGAVTQKGCTNNNVPTPGHAQPTLVLPLAHQAPAPPPPALPSLPPPPEPVAPTPAAVPTTSAPGSSKALGPMPPLHPIRSSSKAHPVCEASIPPMVPSPTVIHQRRMYTPPLPPPAHMHNGTIMSSAPQVQNQNATTVHRMYNYEQAVRVRESGSMAAPVGYSRYSPTISETSGWNGTRAGNHSSAAPPLLFMGGGGGVVGGGGLVMSTLARDSSLNIRTQRVAPPPLSFMGAGSEVPGRPVVHMRQSHHAPWPTTVDSGQQASVTRNYGVINHTRHIVPEQRQSNVMHVPRLQEHVLEQVQPSISHSIQGHILANQRPPKLSQRLHNQMLLDQQRSVVVQSMQGQEAASLHSPSLPHTTKESTRESNMPPLTKLKRATPVVNQPEASPHQHCQKRYTPEILAVVEALILQLLDVGLPSTSASIIHTAKQLLEARDSGSFCCDQEADQWFISFCTRHASSLPQESKEGARTPLPSKQESQQWVEKLRREMASFGEGKAVRVYYLQELNFYLEKHTREIKFHRMFPGKVHCSNEKDTVSVLFILGADGERGPGMVIFPRMVMPEKLFASLKNTENGSDWVLGSSMNGWLYSDCIVEFISDVFVPWLKKRNTQFPVALFTNEYVSNIRLTKMSENLLTQGIQLITVPQNMSLSLSPPELLVAEYFRKHWGRAVKSWSMKNGFKALLEENFAPFIISSIGAQAAPAEVRAKFSQTGIFPFNAQTVYRCLCSQT